MEEQTRIAYSSIGARGTDDPLRIHCLLFIMVDDVMNFASFFFSPLSSCLFSGTAGTMLIVRTSRGMSAQKGFATEEARLRGLNTMLPNIHAN